MIGWFAKMLGGVDPRVLREAGVLGINSRNAEFVLPYNRRSFYPRVDDKLVTKKIAAACDICVPETYAVIDRYGDVGRLPELLVGRDAFVVKPARGAGGRGIMVMAKSDADGCETVGGRTIGWDELSYHISTILSGLYSLGGRPDAAIIEQRLVRHPFFDAVAVGGTPDVRIIVFLGEPVMAMIRLPTEASRGRANLHQGAVAAGVDMATGRTVGGVCGADAIVCHPDTGASIVGLEIPAWGRLLEAATRLAKGLEMGYVGIDFVIDADAGPVMLEANARPGLAIQIANRQGLLPRLEAVLARKEVTQEG